MAIAFRNASTANSGGASVTSINGTLPTGTSQVDTLVAALLTSGGSSVTTAPSGYVAVPGSPLFHSATMGLNVYTRVVGASEPAPSWTFPSAFATLVIAAFTGVSTTTPNDVTPTIKDSSANTSSPSPNTITTVTDGDMIVPIIGVHSNNSGCSFTAAASGYAQAGAAANGGYPVQISYLLQATHGIATPGSSSLTANTNSYDTFTLALNPSSLTSLSMDAGMVPIL